MFAKQQARAPRDWVRDGVIYEIYPRAFSQQGNFNGITARLDELKEIRGDNSLADADTSDRTVKEEGKYRQSVCGA